MNVGVIGCGAAGNKATYDLIRSGFPKDDCLFVNSTPKDIHDEFKANALIFGKDREGGCGKERELGKKLILRDMKNGDFNIDDFITGGNEYNLIILVSSTEGGSGSASLPVLAKYINKVHQIPVICVLFIGFMDDPRGCKNTIEICEELEEDYGTIFIQNNAFMARENNNKIKAEAAANSNFVSIVKSICAAGINNSSQNIDDTDMAKIVMTPGYMTIDEVAVDRFKNMEQYTKFMNSYLDDSIVPDAGEKSAKRIAVFFSCDGEGVDYTGELFKERFGMPYEYFTHIQEPVENSFIRWIISGQKMPIDDIRRIYNNYMKITQKVNRAQDSFFSEVSSFRNDTEDNMFNMVSSKKSKRPTDSAKNKFFADFEETDKNGEDLKEEY